MNRWQTPGPAWSTGSMSASPVLRGESTIQGPSGTVLGAIYHVVEHFSMDTGQLLYLAKERTGRDLAFYRVKGKRWRPTVDGIHEWRRWPSGSDTEVAEPKESAFP